MIGIDNIAPGTSTMPNAHGGMRSYLRDLCLYLPVALPDTKFILFSPTWNPLLDKAEHPNNLETVHLRNVPKSRPLRAGFEQAILPIHIARAKIKIWLGTSNIVPLAANCSKIVILQSHQYLTNPNAFSVIRRKYLQLFARESLRRADRIVVLSHDSEQVIAIRWPWIDRAKVQVVYNRVPTDLVTIGDEGRYQQCRASCDSRPPYILSVSALYAYKNIDRLIQAFARIAKKIPHDLMIVGRETNEVNYADLVSLARNEGVASRVRIEGRLLQPELQAYYSRASLVAIPSLSETFGLPIVEAMWFGVPCVTSKGGTTEEIAGDAGILVDPLNVDSIASGLLRGIQDPNLRDRVIAEGKRRRQLFTAEAMIKNFAFLIDGLERNRGTGRPAFGDALGSQEERASVTPR